CCLHVVSHQGYQGAAASALPIRVAVLSARIDPPARLPLDPGGALDPSAGSTSTSSAPATPGRLQGSCPDPGRSESPALATDDRVAPFRRRTAGEPPRLACPRRRRGTRRHQALLPE